MDKEKWKQHLSEIYSCKKCALHETKTNYVVGKGNPSAKIMLVGEAPGKWEDIKGEPFVGRAGKFLDSLLQEIGLTLNEVFITNILKCRPPNNRDPSEEEVAKCTPHLDKEISLINPMIIAALGRHSMKFLFKKYNISYEPISKIHGKHFPIHSLLGNKYLVALYHPAVALYNPDMKEVLKKDFQAIKKLV
jgi:DNA polymerase